ncbi:MAG TPA: hypothetical protein V6D26_30455 [Stenomitos sp.]
MMRLNHGLALIGLTTLGFFLLTSSHLGFSQTDLNAQLRQALCSQNWGQALEILDQMKRAADPQYRSPINLYRARVQVLARENVKLSQFIDCSAPSPPSLAPANPSVPPTPSSDIAPTPSSNTPLTPSSDIPPLSIPSLPPPPPL